MFKTNIQDPVSGCVSPCTGRHLTNAVWATVVYPDGEPEPDETVHLIEIETADDDSEWFTVGYESGDDVCPRDCSCPNHEEPG